MKKILALLLFTTTVCAHAWGKALPVADNPFMQRSLNGNWKFRLVDGETLPVAVSGWYGTGYNDMYWNGITVLGCWETQGYCAVAQYMGGRHRLEVHAPGWYAKSIGYA